MKKVLALALALVIALSMSAMAFAQTTTAAPAATKPVVLNVCPNGCGAQFYDEAEFNKHLAVCEVKHCTKCGEAFANEGDYNDHVQNCTVGDTKDYINLDIKTILDMIIDLVKSSMTQWGDIESVIVRIVDFVENIGTAAVSEAEVAGAVADLETALADVEIPGLSDLLNQLKAKIKAMYAGEKATTIEATTVADPPAETGSSAAGIAAFAAISVAAAAAYVCTKKSK